MRPWDHLLGVLGGIKLMQLQWMLINKSKFVYNIILIDATSVPSPTGGSNVTQERLRFM
jgi:hypothetical protein